MLGEGAYQNALRRRDQLQEEIGRKQTELDEVSSFLRQCERYAEMTADSAMPLAGPSDDVPPAKKARRKFITVSGMELLPYIRAAMLKLGRPLQRGEIVSALEERGIRVGAKSQPATSERSCGALKSAVRSSA